MRISSPTEAHAVARYVRVSPYKARQVIQTLRGMSVEAAQRDLGFTQKAAARPILKTLNSAIANAEHNKDLDADDLFVLEAKVDEGPTLKRFQPRAMGRAYRIRKRTCHITITVGLPPRDGETPRTAGAATPRTAGAATPSTDGGTNDNDVLATAPGAATSRTSGAATPRTSGAADQTEES